MNEVTIEDVQSPSKVCFSNDLDFASPIIEHDKKVGGHRKSNSVASQTETRILKKSTSKTKTK